MQPVWPATLGADVGWSRLPGEDPGQGWLVAVDLDGTLLAGSGLRCRDAEAISSFTRAGGSVVLATGRIPPMALPIAHDLGLADPLICANGGWVGTPERSVLFARPFLDAEKAPLLDLCRAEGYEGHVVVYSDQFGFVDRTTALLEAYQQQRNAPLVASRWLAAADDVMTLKAMFYVARSEVDALVHRLATTAVPFEVRVGRVGDLEGFPDVVGVEVAPPGVDKCAALLGLARSRGIDQRRVAAVGDGSNDIAMIRWAGRGFAVAGGDPDAIEAADQVVGQGTLPPVAHALDVLAREATPG